MKRKLLVLVIGIMAMFLAGTTFAAQNKSPDQYGDKTGPQMKKEFQTQMDSTSPGMRGDQAQRDRASSGMRGDQQFAAENLKSVDDIKGQNVLDANGETIGKIDSLLVDSRTGKVEYITLTSGGIFGVGGDKYLIPWQALRAATGQEGQFQVNLSSEKLKNAPKGHDVPSQVQSREIHEFYGVSPEWQRQDGVSPERQRQDGLSPDRQR